VIVPRSGRGGKAKGRGSRASERRRRLIGLSRHARTPRQVVYQWDPATGDFRTVGDPHLERFRDNWAQVRTILAGRSAAATHHELLTDWPADRERPAASVLYDWLNRATAAGLVERRGTGTKVDPYRYRLPGDGGWGWRGGDCELTASRCAGKESSLTTGLGQGQRI
jgi:hypothetical protein